MKGSRKIGGCLFLCIVFYGKALDKGVCASQKIIGQILTVGEASCYTFTGKFGKCFIAAPVNGEVIR